MARAPAYPSCPHYPPFSPLSAVPPDADGMLERMVFAATSDSLRSMLSAATTTGRGRGATSPTGCGCSGPPGSHSPTVTSARHGDCHCCPTTGRSYPASCCGTADRRHRGRRRLCAGGTGGGGSAGRRPS